MAAAAPAQQRRLVDPSYGKAGMFGMACSGGGPAAAALFSNPLDGAKVRMMMQGEGAMLASGARAYTGPIDCIRKTYASEGIVGVQRGLSMA